MISDIFTSIRHSIDALGYLTKPWVFKYLLLSGLISLLTFAAFFASVLFFGDDLTSGVIHSFSSGIKWNWLNSILEWLVRIILFAGGIFIFKYVVLIVTGPFMSALSEKLEQRLTNVETPKVSKTGQLKGISRGIRLSISNLFREMILVGLLFLLSIIPGVAIFTSVLFFLVGAYYAGFGNIDFFMERRYSAKQSRNFIKRNKGLAIGNGSVFLGLFMIPILGAFIAPTICTISGTLSGLKRLDVGSDV